MNTTCPRCGGKLVTEQSPDGDETKCLACGRVLQTWPNTPGRRSEVATRSEKAPATAPSAAVSQRPSQVDIPGSLETHRQRLLAEREGLEDRRRRAAEAVAGVDAEIRAVEAAVTAY